MNRKLFLAILAAAATIGAVSCTEKGPAEQAGERIDDAVSDARDAAEDARDAAEDAADEIRDALEDN